MFSGVCAVVYFVVGIRFDQVFIADTPTPIGEFAVLLMILLFAGSMVWVYRKKWEPVRNMIGGSLLVLLIAYLVSEYLSPFNLVWVEWGLCVVTIGYLLYLSLSERQRAYLLIGLFALGSIGFLYSSDYVFDNILEPHQQIRIKVVLGMEEDLAGACYNVNQSKIAIGSGGLTGKGFLNGTQTKLKYVPEPTNPCSSPTVQKMKSVSCSGTYFSLVCVPFRKPLPFNPPEPIAIFDWLTL